MNPRQFQEKRVSVTQACDLVEHITTRAGTTSEVESRDGIIRFQDEASVPTQHTQPLLVCTSLQIKIHIHGTCWDKVVKESREIDG